jgi:hypothetical protein
MSSDVKTVRLGPIKFRNKSHRRWFVMSILELLALYFLIDLTGWSTQTRNVLCIGFGFGDLFMGAFCYVAVRKRWLTSTVSRDCIWWNPLVGICKFLIVLT